MSDDQLVQAMRTHPAKRKLSEDGDWSCSALSQIRSYAASQKPRFLKLLKEFPADVEPDYRHAVVEGLLATQHEGFVASEPNELPISELMDLVAQYAGTDCPQLAQAICLALSERRPTYPDEWLQALLSFALDHPDPASPEQHVITSDGAPDLATTGMNRVRGVARHALARALFGSPQAVAKRLRPHMAAMVADPASSARCAVIEMLIAWLNVDRLEAVQWFLALISGHEILLSSTITEHFLGYACGKHHDELGDVVEAMTLSPCPKAREMGTRQCIRNAFEASAWVPKAGKLLSHPDANLRAAAAGEVSHYWPTQRYRDQAERWLNTAFQDRDAAVSRAAANVFRYVEPHEWAESEEFVQLFAHSPALVTAPDSLLWRLAEANPVPVNLVLHVAGTLLDAYLLAQAKSHLPTITHEVPKLVLLAYHNTALDSQRTACLDLLDRLLLEGFYGVTELVKASSEQQG